MAESVDYVHPTLSTKGVIVELTGFKGQVEIALNSITGVVESYGVVTSSVNYICDTMLEILQGTNVSYANPLIDQGTVNL